MNIKKLTVQLTVIVGSLLYGYDSYSKNTVFIDSIGVENNEGKQIILHQLTAKENYYAVGRKYGVSAKDIISFNKNKSLKIGDVIKVPTSRPFQALKSEKSIQVLPGAVVTQTAKDSTTPLSGNNTGQQPDPAFIEYRVGAGETLYTIAKRFEVSVETITETNHLQGKAIQPNQVLRIPQANEEPAPAPIVEVDEEMEPTEEPSTPANRYGLRQVSDRGIGVWMEGLNTEGGKMLALHKTAPIGTVIKITNPMTQRTTFAKVVGKYTDNSQTKDAVIVISKAAATQIGIIDKRFLVNISYGVPNE